jgi:D-arabinose 5-phosphate isomerase GutQ
MVTPDDIVLAISNSGESDEIGAILPAIKRLGVKLVAITGGADSSLARHADVVVSSAVDQEACPLNLAPTASTTAQMALGDAWPSPCSMPAAFARRTSHAPIRAAASAASSSCTSPT